MVLFLYAEGQRFWIALYVMFQAYSQLAWAENRLPITSKTKGTWILANGYVLRVVINNGEGARCYKTEL